jgi:hypothetical protein
LNFSTYLIPQYVLLSVVMPYLTNFVQLEFSGVVLDGRPDGVNAVKFDADLSMLLSGGMSFVCLLSVAYLPFRQLWSYIYLYGTWDHINLSKRLMLRLPALPRLFAGSTS